MTPDAFLKLAVQTVTDPRSVARLLLSIRPGTEALLTGFALVVVLNAVVFSASLLLSPPQATVPALFSSPVGFMLTQTVTLGGTIVALAVMGRWFGGAGGLPEVAVLMIWMQALRVLVQAAMLVIAPISAMLGGLVFLATAIVGFWILLNFVDEAHEFGSLGRAFLVLVLGMLALGFALSIILTMAGVTPEGMMGNV